MSKIRQSILWILILKKLVLHHFVEEICCGLFLKVKFGNYDTIQT